MSSYRVSVEDEYGFNFGIRVEAATEEAAKAAALARYAGYPDRLYIRSISAYHDCGFTWDRHDNRNLSFRLPFGCPVERAA